MKITKNTKGLTGSITHIDTDELHTLRDERDKFKKALEEIRDYDGYESSADLAKEALK